MMDGVAIAPGAFPALVLNADFRPLSYFPLSLCSWQDSLRAVFRGNVTVIAEYDQTVRSPSMSMRVPSVIALTDYVHTRGTSAFTRFNVFLRDHWCCQYCSEQFRTSQLTFDHVIPRSRGGGTCWENIVTACRPCNTLKADHLPEECGMHTNRPPRQPTTRELRQCGRKFPPNFLHESWADFLYWDTELEKTETVREVKPTQAHNLSPLQGLMI